MPMMRLSRVAEVTVEALRAGLEHATSELLDIDPVDSEAWLGSSVSDAQRDELLAALLSDCGFGDEDLQFHLGEPPIPADRRVHTVMSGVIRSKLPGAYVVGEEATTSEWDQAEKALQHAQIFTLDAIDGSVPYACLGFGFSSNIVVHQRIGVADSLLLSAVANSSGILILYYEGQVLVGDINHPQALTIAPAPLIDDPKTGSVAVLGALPRHRAMISGVLKDRAATVFTTAGAPAAAGLVVGSLESLVAQRPQTLHDAAYLPALLALKITVVTQDGENLELRDVESMFSRTWTTAHPRQQRPCPAFVASRNPTRAFEIAEQLGWKNGR